MSEQKDKITNLTIYYRSPSHEHILEARYESGVVKAILTTNNPEKIESMIRIIKASTPTIYIYSFIKDTYDNVTN